MDFTKDKVISFKRVDLSAKGVEEPKKVQTFYLFLNTVKQQFQTVKLRVIFLYYSKGTNSKEHVKNEKSSFNRKFSILIM